MKKIFIFILLILISPFVDLYAYNLRIKKGDIPFNAKLYAKVYIFGNTYSDSTIINKDDYEGFENITNNPLEVQIPSLNEGFFKVKLILIESNGKRIELNDSYPMRAANGYNIKFIMRNNLIFRVDSTNTVYGAGSNLIIVQE